MDPLSSSLGNAPLPPEIVGAVARDVALSAHLPEAAASDLGAIIQAGGGSASAVLLAEQVAAAAAATPFPSMALGNFARWVTRLGSGGSVYRLMLEDPRLVRHFAVVLSSSQYLADILARDPDYYDVILEPTPRSAEDLRAALSDLTRAFATVDGGLNALRRARRREMLRIGWADLTGTGVPHAEPRGPCYNVPLFRAVVAGISGLADALIQTAYDLCAQANQLPFAIIAMGKLGGRELNYSSDVDLLFVYDAPSADDTASFKQANQLAERIVAALAKPTHEGYLFRADIRLRPGGRSGHLARSLASYLEHYERWPDVLERQALIKARPVAGDPELGTRFLAATRSCVYQPTIPASFFDEVRANKEALERRVEDQESLGVSVKEGQGGIRDVEFAVQFLQMLFGARMSELQTGNTMEAIGRLRAAGLLADDTARQLEEGYVFLRTVEHRLQLLHDLPVRTLPAAGGEAEALAARCGFPSAEAFANEYQRQTAMVREAFTAVFHATARDGEPSPDARLRGLILNIDTRSANNALTHHLQQRGFQDPPRVLQTLRRLALGSEAQPAGSAQRRALANLIAPLLDAAAETPSPDDAIAYVETVADLMGPLSFLKSLEGQLPAHPTPHAALYPLDVLCKLGGAAPVLGQLLARHPQLIDAALDPAFAAESTSKEDLARELSGRLLGARSSDGVAAVLRRFRARHYLRIGLADLLYDADVEDVCRALTDLADVIVAAALGDSKGFAVLGLGRLGGGEMQYGSDLDMLYLAAAPDRDYLRLASSLTETLTALTPDGPLYEVDLRLRPEGRHGLLSMSVEGALGYYRDRAMVWEKQSMVKARYVAGEAELVEEFLAGIRPMVYPSRLPQRYEAEMSAMKRRIERERLKQEERHRDLKLGPGGLTDIEFLVQLMQMRHGARHPQLRGGGVLKALRTLSGIGLLPESEAEELMSAYRFALRTRNALHLLGHASQNVMPLPGAELERLARRLGYENGGALVEEHQRLAAAARRIFEARFPQ